MTADMQSRLRDALEHRVADVRPSTDSLDTIAHELGLAPAAVREQRDATTTFAATPAPSRTRRRWPAAISGLAVAAAVAALLVALVAGFGHSDGSDSAGLPGFPLPASDYVIGVRNSPSDAGQDYAVIRVRDGEIVGNLPSSGAHALVHPVLSTDGKHLYALRDVDRTDLPRGQALISVDTVTGRETNEGVRPSGSSREESLVLSADGSVLGGLSRNLVGGNKVDRVDFDSTDFSRESSSGLPDSVVASASAGSVAFAVGPRGHSVALSSDTVEPSVLQLIDTKGTVRQLGSSGARCPAGNEQRLTEPQWTAQGLYALRGCGQPGRQQVDIVAVDPTSGTVSVVHRLPQTSLAGLRMVALDGPRFVVGDNAAKDAAGTIDVTSYDPADGWRAATIRDLVQFPA